jgi:hypothetical protein
MALIGRLVPGDEIDRLSCTGLGRLLTEADVRCSTQSAAANRRPLAKGAALQVEKISSSLSCNLQIMIL